MKITDCKFYIKNPKGGEIVGRYSDGQVFLSGLSGSTPNRMWRGQSFLSKEEQSEYLDLLKDAVGLQNKIFG